MIVPLLSHHVKALGASPTVAGIVGEFCFFASEISARLKLNSV